MSNIARHSNASVVDLALQKTGERLELTIQDNGQDSTPVKSEKGSVCPPCGKGRSFRVGPSQFSLPRERD